ncbi:hypothetical protein GCM10025877_20180 [Agromyces mangrovi Wang et al. 2018]|nr:hypothetical protein GCM10025877_20180 [Agromyces mangrovi]
MITRACGGEAGGITCHGVSPRCHLDDTAGVPGMRVIGVLLLVSRPVRARPPLAVRQTASLLVERAREPRDRTNPATARESGWEPARTLAQKNMIFGRRLVYE